MDEAQLTVEHILPLNPKMDSDWIDDFGDNWRLLNQRLGNMALVTAADNRSLAQKNFKDKKVFLEDTSCAINSISKYSKWDAQSVESRQHEMARLASQAWRIDE